MNQITGKRASQVWNGWANVSSRQRWLSATEFRNAFAQLGQMKFQNLSEFLFHNSVHVKGLELSSILNFGLDNCV